MSCNRSTERDFLRENKQNVRYWESNGRVAAAASAQRVPRWRPVVLHYPERLRPHGEIARRGRTLRPMTETLEMRSGLARPYGFAEDDHELLKRRCNCREREREQQQQQRDMGGWSENGVQSQTEDIKDARFLNRELSKCKSRASGGQQDGAGDAHCHCSRASHASHSSRASHASGGSRASQASRASHASRTSHASRKTLDPGATGDVANEAPVSARSGGSVVTLRTLVSNKSKKTIKSQASQKTKASKDTDRAPKSDSNYTLITDSERRAALNEAHVKYNQLIYEYNRLPVSAATLRVRNRKVAIERELDELDCNIQMYDQPAIYARRY